MGRRQRFLQKLANQKKETLSLESFEYAGNLYLFNPPLEYVVTDTKFVSFQNLGAYSDKGPDEAIKGLIAGAIAGAGAYPNEEVYREIMTKVTVCPLEETIDGNSL